MCFDLDIKTEISKPSEDSKQNSTYNATELIFPSADKITVYISQNGFLRFVPLTFLAPLAIGQRAYVMVCCSPCVRLCVNFFFKHLLWNSLSDFDEISQKSSWYGPFQNFLKKNWFRQKLWLPWQQNWKKKMKTLKTFLSETIRIRATKFGM